MASTAYNYLAIYDGVPSGAAGVILNDNFSDISDLTLDSIQGLHTSNGADASHDIDITTGAATDSTNASVLVLGTAITKQIDASWSVGTAAGGLDTGSVTTSTWYAIWLIKRSDTGVVDALFSTSFSSPTMPTNYDYKRYIGAVLTDGSSNIYGYTQTGNSFWWDAWVNDLSDTTPATAITTLRVSVPPIACEWLGGGYFRATVSNAERLLELIPGDKTAYGAGFQAVGYVLNQEVGMHVGAGFFTNSSGQIKYRSSHNTGYAFWIIRSFGWIDPRGRAVE